MKRCPRCGQVYSDPTINFCLNDGELLVDHSGAQGTQRYDDETPTRFADESPPTLVMDSPRITNQGNWQSAPPPAAWQNQGMASPQQTTAMGGFSLAKDQTLPMVSLVLGVLAGFLVCCFGGIWLGLPAAVVGFLGMKNADNDPGRYGGRGMAIAGMVLGIITFVISLAFLIFGQLAN